MTLGDHNLALLSEAAHERLGGRGVLHFEGARLTGGKLHERTLRLGEGFRRLGVRAGDRVVVYMANRPEVGIVYVALWRAGAVITPAIFLLPPPDVRHLLEDSEAVAVVTTPEFLPNARLAAEGLPGVRWIVSAGPAEDGVVSLEELESSDPGPVVERDDDDLAAVLYTGGTTGRAKGVMLSHDNLWHCGKSSYEATHVPGVNRTIVPIPLSHAFGLIVSVAGMHVREPGEAVLMRWFDPEGWLRAVEEHRMQRSTMVPTMLQVLLGCQLEAYELSSLRYVNSGASPLPVEVAEEFERRVPGAEVLEGYGLTESGAAVSVNRPGARKLGSVGPPLPGYEVRIVDDGGREVPTGEPGEICCRSRGVMRGYWRAPEATDSALVDGWLHTGDIGRIDEDGYLWVLDRKKDLIIRGGFNVFPRDVEDVLLEHPAVLLAGVVGRPDPVRGEEVVAFVSLFPGHDVEPAALVRFARERLPAPAYPREIQVLPAVPITPVGKVDRKALRAMVAAR